MRRLPERAWVLVVCGVAAAGCSRRGPAEVPVQEGSPAPAGALGAAENSRPVLLDVVRDLDGCALGHRGVLLDFGDPSMRRDLHPGSFARADDEEVEHEGATWLRARSRGMTASFYWPGLPGEVGANAYVEARIRGMSARTIAFAIDGKPLGAMPLGKGGARVGTVRSALPLAVGGHEIELVFGGGSRSQGEPLAEIDWVHIGTGDPGEPYAAPTRADVLREATAGGRSLRALALKAPGFARCSGWVPANATLEASLSTAGGGDAEVEARLVRDRKPPVVLGTAHVAAGGMAWTPWSVPLTGLDGEGALGAIELIATRTAKGTRVLVGEPRLVGIEPAAAAPMPPARSVVLVVLGAISPRELSPWGGAHAVPELARLSAAGVSFDAHRASSSLANSVFASILTGLPARVHGVDDPDARLPAGATTIEEACRQGGVATAMFTANPTTGAAFGFDRGWDTFVSHDPTENAPATEVFDEAAAWIEAHKAERFLAVVHARGAHPPWDVSPDEVRQLPPDSYIGIIEPRRAAEALAKAKKHPGRFKEDDRVRTWALYDHAIDAHDAALGRLLAAVRGAGLEDDTAVIVTGDVGPSEAGPVPFVESDTLEESVLTTPLVIRWPHPGASMRRRVQTCSSPVDLARTIVAALGLPPPPSLQGVDLAQQAAGAVVPAERPLGATRGDRLAVRWGSFTLQGLHQREGRLCDLSLDPTCVADVHSTSPLALESLRRWLVENVGHGSAAAFPREGAVLDARAKAALVRWGRLSSERDSTDEH